MYLFGLLPIIPIIIITKKLFFRNKVKYHFISFYSEGPPYDKGKPLHHCVERVRKNAQRHFDAITFYTPSLLGSLGYSTYLREYPLTPLIQQYTPVEKIGLSSFRPSMYLYELSKMRDGDILVHRDINYRKYPSYILVL